MWDVLLPLSRILTGEIYVGPYPSTQRELRAIALAFPRVLRPVMLQ